MGCQKKERLLLPLAPDKDPLSGVVVVVDQSISLARPVCFAFL